MSRTACAPKQQALGSASSTKQARGMAKLQKQAGEFCLACVGHVGGTIGASYRVRKEAGLDASTAAAVEAAVAPGAAYRAARDAVSAALCDVEYYKTAANAVKRAIADEANNVLDDYAQRVADADRAVDGLDFSFEGATRLRHLLSDATPTLEAVRDCVVAITAADAPRGGRLVDFCRDRAQRAGAPQVAHALRRLTAAAEKAVLRACCAWCVRGDLCRDFFVRAARRAVSEPWPPLRAEHAPVLGAQPSLGRFELDANAVPRSLASKHLAERILFLGGATRVLRAAATRRRDAAAREVRRRRFLRRAVAEIEAEPRFGGLVRLRRPLFLRRGDGVTGAPTNSSLDPYCAASMARLARQITTHRSRPPASPSRRKSRTRTRRRPRAPGATSSRWRRRPSKATGPAAPRRATRGSARRWKLS